MNLEISNNNNNIEFDYSIINDTYTINELYNFITNFSLKKIPSNIRFWMVRTKKGYFYNEFISKKFVALAWNNITITTNLEEDNSEGLNQLISLEYPEIKRPTLVINKCKSFIYEIKKGDILVIPSDGSKYITFAYAGDYYEEETKTPEVEKKIIGLIEHSEVIINEVNCPYRKRRHITPIRTIKNDELNYHLFKAISSYHGISNFDKYGTIILDHLFNYYTFNENTRLVFHVSKTNSITSTEFSGFLYSMNSILGNMNLDNNIITTQASVHSVGDIVFNIYKSLADNYLILIAIAVILGGGNFLTVELPGIPAVLQKILSIKTNHQKEQAELDSIKLENLNKALDIKKKLNDANLTLDDLNNIKLLADCSKSMKIIPIENLSEPTVPENTDVQTDDEEAVL